jgi:hypothetical protein
VPAAAAAAACSDMVFTICFAIEALMKVVAFGFKPYICFFQNQVDFTIVLTSLVMLTLDTMDLEIIKVRNIGYNSLNHVGHFEP